MVSVADLIAYRQRKESLVERVEVSEISTPYGPARAYTYATQWDPMQHLAVVFGDVRDGVGVPVRLHLESVIDDVFGVAAPLDGIVRRVAERGRGIIVYLREGSVGVGQGRTRHMAESEGEDHGSARSRMEEWREIGLGAQILKDLGVSSIRLMASRERRYIGLAGFDIAIEATDIIEN